MITREMMLPWLTLPAIWLLAFVAPVAAGDGVELYLRSTMLIPDRTVDQHGAAMVFGELSGVTYDADSDTFWAVNDGSRKLVRLRVGFKEDGAIAEIEVVAGLRVAHSRDFEGIVFTNTARNSVFLSEEDGPGVHEYRLTDGVKLQSLRVPAVFTKRRGNRGFEALGRSPDGSVMLTGVEEALKVDGPRSSAAAGSVVRLLRYDVKGNRATPAAQYAYVTDPIHAASQARARCAGLVELLFTPEGTVLAVERSYAGGLDFRTRIYALDFTAATDVSKGELAAGLIDQTFTPVAKGEAIFTGNVLNLEGLALGPQLAPGRYALLGVIDTNQQGPNVVVSFELHIGEAVPSDERGD